MIYPITGAAANTDCGGLNLGLGPFGCQNGPFGCVPPSSDFNPILDTFARPDGTVLTNASTGQAWFTLPEASVDPWVVDGGRLVPSYMDLGLGFNLGVAGVDFGCRCVGDAPRWYAEASSMRAVDGEAFGVVGWVSLGGLAELTGVGIAWTNAVNVLLITIDPVGGLVLAPLASTTGAPLPVEGDLVRAVLVGDSISFYVNGVLYGSTAGVAVDVLLLDLAGLLALPQNNHNASFGSFAAGCV